MKPTCLGGTIALAGSMIQRRALTDLDALFLEYALKLTPHAKHGLAEAVFLRGREDAERDVRNLRGAGV